MKPAVAMMFRWMADEGWVETSAGFTKETPEAEQVFLPREALFQAWAEFKHQPHTFIAFVEGWELRSVEVALMPRWSTRVMEA